MGEKSNISWTESSWNPVTGCSKVSEGCRHCYAETLSLRMGWSDAAWTMPNAARNVVLHPDRLDMPLKWRKPRMIFVNSMSDLFHERVPFDFIDAVFRTICGCSGRHTFQILTKRPERMVEWFAHAKTNHSGWFSPSTGNLDLWQTWVGTSVESQREADIRIPHLLRVPTTKRFLSCEPLLGPVNLAAISHAGTLANVAPGVDLPFNLTINALTGEWFDGWDYGSDADFGEHRHIGWVIVGGESGAHLSGEQDDRWMDPAWARDIRDQCQAAGVPFFMKQHSGKRPGQQPYIIEADHTHTEWHQFPEGVTV